MSLQSIKHDPFEKNVEEGGRQKTYLPYSDSCFDLFSHAAIQLDCTCSFVIKQLSDSVVRTRFALILFEIIEDMV